MPSPDSGPLEFASTRWSLIGRATSRSEPQRKAALDELLELYWPALRTHLMVRRGLDSHRAEDVLQEFILQKILERDLLERADQQRGRFRALLLTALDRFAIDQGRRLQSRQRVIQEHAEAEGNRDRSISDSATFDSVWAQTVVRETIRRMWVEAQKKSDTGVWTTFWHRILLPMVSIREPLPYEQLVVLCGFATPHHAANALTTAKRVFQRHLRETVAEYSSSTEEIETEIAELHQALAAAQAWDLQILPDELATELATATENASSSGSGRQPLSLLLERDQSQAAGWNAAECGGMLRHVLASRCDALLNAPGRDEVVSDLPRFDQLRLQDLLDLPQPPIEALERLKQLGRDWSTATELGIPSDLGACLYFLAIATAFVRLGLRITKSNDATLQAGMQLLLGQPWLTPQVARIFRSALERLAAGG